MKLQRPLFTQGFTLVEMAVVLVIVGLILGGLLMPLSAQMDQRNYSDTQKSMDEIKEALIGYALSHGYFPCPAISATNGAEDRTGVTCTGGKRVGLLPWAELGVTQIDGWGHRFGYSVTLAYADSGTKITISPLTAADITIQTRDSSGTIQNLSNAGAIPAAIVSFGKNGFFGYTNDGTLIANSSSTNLDEIKNSNGNGNGKTFVSRIPTSNTTVTGGEFDDVVTWISPNVYLNRMVSAGQLP
jgi:prepilin-type N-terminal cleavage/methylation domain-containing protein